MSLIIDFDNVYDQNGRIIQLDYAKKAVDKSSTVIALKNSRGAVMLSMKPIISKLHILERDNTIFRVSENCYMGSTGLISDRNFFNWLSKKIAENYKETYKTEVSGEYLREKLNEYLFGFTQRLGSRVVGAEFIIMKREDDQYSLYHADSTGKVSKYKAYVMGSMHRRALTEIEKFNLEEMSMEQLVDAGVKTFYKCFDPLNDKEFDLEIGVISDESNGKFVRLAPEQVKSFVDKYSDLTIDDIE